MYCILSERTKRVHLYFKLYYIFILTFSVGPKEKGHAQYKTSFKQRKQKLETKSVCVVSLKSMFCYL